MILHRFIGRNDFFKIPALIPATKVTDVPNFNRFNNQFSTENQLSKSNQIKIAHYVLKTMNSVHSL